MHPKLLKRQLQSENPTLLRFLDKIESIHGKTVKISSLQVCTIRRKQRRKVPEYLPNREFEIYSTQQKTEKMMHR